jgi:hypothetical protein
METKLTLKNSGTWVREVHASFKKVVAFDLLFFALGAITGGGIVGIIFLS